MSDLIAIGYDSLADAQQVATNVAALQKSHEIELEDLVVVESQADGKIKLHQPSAAGAGAVGGALWGGLIGLIFFVPFLGMAIGAASGAAAGALSDYGVDDNFMKQLGSSLPPGGAAVIALVTKMPPDRVLENVKIKGTIIQTSLGDVEQGHLAAALAKAGS
jgi:uncharacterized membrane protein